MKKYLRKIVCVVLMAVMLFALPAQTVKADDSSIEEFVTRLYTLCLNREPDEKGLDDWCNLLLEGTYTGTQVAHGFVFSNEFINAGYADDEYVKQLYRVFLSREYDAEGLATWLGMMHDKGYGREAIFNGFSQSTEFKSLCEEYGIVAGDAVGKVADDISSFVIRFYQIYFGRGADPTGLATWTNALKTKEMSAAEVAYGFVFSTEFTSKNYDDATFIEYMYRAFLDRSADATGIETWTTCMADGWTREDVFYGFVESNEFARVCESYGIDRDASEKPSAGHNMGEWEVVTAATCTTAGSEKRVCTDADCEYSETREIEASGHTEGTEWIIDKNATCSEAGSKHTECTVCKTVIKTEAIPMVAHTEGDWIIDKAATCTEAGSKHKECTVCGATTTEATVIPAIGHNMGEWTTVTNATCAEAGSEKQVCTNANCTHFETRDIEALGHKESTEWITDKNATCSEAGSRHTECTVCKTVIKTEAIPMVAHTEGDWIIDKAATCTEAGSKHKECTVCGTTTTEATVIEATGHGMGEWTVVTEPTCTANGSEKKVCTNTGCEHFETRTVEALGHTESDWIIDVAATCTEAGSKHKECTVCEKVMVETTEILATGHIESEWITDVEVLCLTDGSRHTACTLCGKTMQTETVPALGHDMQQVKIEPTCTSYGSRYSKCVRNNCTHNTKPLRVDKLPHTEGEWIIDEDATCTDNGSKHTECSVCGNVVSKGIVEALGQPHNYEVINTVLPTCETGGYTEEKCSTCNVITVTNELEALGHDYKVINVVSATCEAGGYTEEKCSRCNEIIITNEIEALGHNYEVSNIVSATCEAGGYTEETCSRCKSEIITNKVEALGHSADEWSVIKEPELGVPGIKVYDCIVCGKNVTDEIPMLLTDGVDSVYFFTNEDENGNKYQDFVVGHFDDARAEEMLELVNAHRKRYDTDEKYPKNPLSTTWINSKGKDVTENVNAYAEERAVEITENFDHYSPTGAKCDYPENIAWVPNEYATTQEVFEAWRDSSGHNTNMLHPGYAVTRIECFFAKYDTDADNNYAQYWVQICSE